MQTPAVPEPPYQPVCGFVEYERVRPQIGLVPVVVTLPPEYETT